MLTSLDWLIIVFMGFATLSLLALCLMLLIRHPRAKQVCFYAVAGLGIGFGLLGAYVWLAYFPLQVFVGIVSALMGVAAILLERRFKDDRQKLRLVRLLAGAAMIVGLFNLFL